MTRLTKVKASWEIALDKAHHALRNHEGMVGIEAWEQLCNFIAVRLLQGDGKIMIDSLVRMNEIIKVIQDQNSAADLFVPVRIMNQHTIDAMWSCCKELPLDKEDLLGAAYEHFLQFSRDTAAKSLGQHFTNRTMVELGCRLVGLTARPDRTPPTILDPTCGTGGFLVRATNVLTRMGVLWEASYQKRLVGRDTSAALVRASKINMMACIGMGGFIERQNTYSEEIEGEYEYVLANPPYGGAPMRYSDACPSIARFGVESRTKECLFVQLCAQKLVRGGGCVVVVPRGLLFRTSGELVRFRRHLMRRYCVEAIVEYDQQQFHNTPIHTSMVIFRRPADDPSSVPATHTVRFLRPDETTMCTIDMETISSSQYKLVSCAYLQKAVDESLVRLGDVAVIEPGERIVRRHTEPGTVPVYGGGDRAFTSMRHNRDQPTSCKISRFGVNQNNCVMLIHGKFFLNDSGVTVRSRDPEVILSESLWCCLLAAKDRVYALARGTAQKNINTKQLGRLPIRIPSREMQLRQRELVKRRAHLVAQLQSTDQALLSIDLRNAS